MVKEIEIFVSSDVHGKFDELWTFVVNEGFQPNNSNHLFIMNGDIIDAHDSEEKIVKDVENIAFLMKKHDNIIYLKGNHEDKIITSKKWVNDFLKKLPIVFINDNLLICHGWFNPLWSIKDHQCKKTSDDMLIANSGDILYGSPQNISYRNTKNRSYYDYNSLEQYESQIIEKWPNHKFVFGHYPSFFLQYDEWEKEPYTTYQDELEKMNKKLSNLITKMVNNFEYWHPYASPRGKFHIIDVYTKCHRINIKHHFFTIKFFSESKGQTYDKNGKVVRNII